MAIVYLLSWWYSAGWRQRFQSAQHSIAKVLDFFSIGLLLKTFFAPFRQIDTGKVSGGLDVQLKAFFNRLISRIVGAFLRFFMIVAGGVVLVLTLLFEFILLVAWAIVPLLPIVGLVLTLGDWLPWAP